MNVNYSNIREDEYVVQGLTIIDNLFFISAYKSHDYSRIYVYDKYGYLGKIILNNKHHVGGISFDKKNNIIFITGSSTSISTYNYLKIKKYIKKNFTLDLNIKTNIIIPNDFSTIFRAASLFIYKGYVYIVNFGLSTKLAKINYSFNKKMVHQICQTDLGIINNAFCVQGICFDKNNLYLSSSLGPIKSFISVYNFKLHLTNRIIINQPGIEGIIIKANNLYSVYEKGIANISVFPFDILNQFKTKSLFLKTKYSLSYFVYNKYKNRKR